MNYAATRHEWAAGPMRVYDVVAERLCRLVTGGLVLDVGAGAGSATTALRRRGADVVAVDIAVGQRPAVAADAMRLPFRDRAFDAVMAAFCFNHLDDPVAALVEARRVLRPGGAAVVAVWAEADDHPVKAAVELAAAAAGWTAPEWYDRLRRDAAPLLATVERAEEAALAAGVQAPFASVVDVAVPGLDVDALLAWRTGMPHLAPFFSSLPPADRRRVLADARARLGDNVPPLVRSVLVLRWVEAHNSRVARAAAASGDGDAFTTRATMSSA